MPGRAQTKFLPTLLQLLTLTSPHPLFPQMARPIQVKPADSESRGGSCHLSVTSRLGVGGGMGEEGKVPAQKAAVVTCLLTHQWGGDRKQGLCPLFPTSGPQARCSYFPLELEIPDSPQRSVMGIFRRRGDGVPEGLWIDFWGCVYVCV